MGVKRNDLVALLQRLHQGPTQRRRDHQIEERLEFLPVRGLLHGWHEQQPHLVG
jgi:hypothetical protein